MKKQLTFLFAFIAVTLCTTLVWASDKGGDRAGTGHTSFNRHFDDMDTDGNDTLSFDEFKAVFPSTEQKGFNTLDTDKNGALDHDEWHQFKEMHKGMGYHHGKKKHHTKKMPDPSVFNAHFPDMDGDKDDKISPREFKTHFPDRADHDTVFTAIDLDKNGYLDHDEWHEFKSAHGLKHKD